MVCYIFFFVISIHSAGFIILLSAYHYYRNGAGGDDAVYTDGSTKVAVADGGLLLRAT